VIAIEGPTWREVSERLRLREKEAAGRAHLVALWRARNPQATCSDRVALLLAELQRDHGGTR
jgi:hypothetical protein